MLCWGSDSDGQSSPPEEAFVEISSSSELTCGRRDDSSLACWGTNGYGATDGMPDEFVRIASGYQNNCALRANGVVVCWEEP